MNLSEDKIGRPPMWPNDLSSVAYIHVHVCCQQCKFQPHVNFICTLDLEVVNFSEEMTWFAFYLVLGIEFSICQSTNLKKRRLDLFCNYHHVQCVCNRSHFFFLAIFHFTTFLAKFYC